ncbi:transposase, IS605 OrfB family (plasmid) [Rhodothermus marinus SG0.5JP17-172]|uniref:RNA-guided endonuclease InsQ/TnpB family protein n=1 Tax=Rhodothermus marinus TaxID=29549 RepID=UPI000223D274|nr:RNA-guided endonuclease TnpB family protein [Rhodothermus marinus]AEN74779.1 transposase, IS605 OrfB family [Rhodothermus marinus SG0.5JP17-172]
MRTTFKYRLYRSKRDKHLIEQIEVAASIWNHSVALTRRYYRIYGKYPGANRLMKHIARLRRRNPYWQKLGSQAVQDVIQRLDRAYWRFFSDPKAGRPRFKKRERYSSFTLKQAGWKYPGGNRIRIGKHNYKFVLSRPIQGEIKTVTIKRDRVGRLWICFSVVTEEQPKPPAPHEAVMRPVGLDFGLKCFLTLSDGTKIQSPEFFRRGLQEVRKAHRALSRKQRGSNNYRKARVRLAKVYDRISNQRRDWFFKTAHALCERYDFIALEDLNIEGMKRRWGRKVSDLGFGEFVSILEHVARKRGVRVAKVARFFPSSRRCSCCGWVKENLSLADREWTCERCGTVHDRDENAAINICREGASSLGVGDVRPPEAAVAV